MLQINTPFFYNVSCKLLKNLIDTPAIMIPFIPLLNAPLINGCSIETKITADSEKKATEYTSKYSVWYKFLIKYCFGSVKQLFLYSYLGSYSTSKVFSKKLYTFPS